MNGRNDRRNQWNPGKLVGLGIVLLVTQPMLIVPLLIFGGIGYAVYYFIIKPAQSGGAVAKQRQKNGFDDCPQPLFCFHKDKGEHHVKRGREIDPWDRPDIDISKYQRRS